MCLDGAIKILIKSDKNKVNLIDIKSWVIV